MKKTILTSFAIIFLASLVSAIGVTYPYPQNIELAPGQSSYFTFQIQSDDFKLNCVPILENKNNLELAFNQQYNVEANQRLDVSPQVIAPKKTPLGNYKSTFCIECSPTEKTEGSKIVPRICNLPITVNVVSERTRENMFDEEKTNMVFLILLLVIAILIITTIILFIILKRRSARQRV